MNLTINNQNITATVRVEDYLDPKLCKVIITITEQQVINGQTVPVSYDLIEAYTYTETWSDSDIATFATEKVNKRFS